ncbi:hypothetical protein BRI6_0692 [plant metagenome]|uniref:Uncharacterized protein n=1 Tax=plant metagenome TaxID=1297885 RepID=A0A484TQ89_9ZZZZ
MGHVVRLPENGRRRPVRAARFTGKGNAASPGKHAARTCEDLAGAWREKTATPANSGSQTPKLPLVSRRAAAGCGFYHQPMTAP